MKALTIHQPFASAIITGLKRVENRSWQTRYRGPLAIHASKAPTQTEWLTYVQEIALMNAGLEIKSLPHGAIIGIVELVDCRYSYEYIADNPRDEWAFGPMCWVMANPRKLATPIPIRGRLGLWNIDTGKTDMILSQLQGN